MKISKLSLLAFRSFFLILLSVLIFSCQDKEKKKGEDQNEEASATKVEEKEDSKNQLMSIVTSAMEFKTKDKWQSGWTTIRYKNNSNETHFILFDKYPDGKTIEDAEKEVGPPFQKGMDLINEGKLEEANAEFGKLPEWFQEVEFTGGVGLIAPKSTAQSTIFLEPGTYVIECYVKMANGVFHNTQGMAKQIDVVEAESDNSEPPQADYTISINATDGIVLDENVSAGKKTFEVDFGEQKLHENFVMHDVHLVWVDQGADMTALNNWMNWTDPKGLQTPSPQGFKFLGGMQEMRAGKKGYFTVDLRPGEYALISEVPDPEGKGLLKTFSVK
ncbi:hypothetical protein [Christiangramia echinicola]|uniref:Uncharacterized protein n=1 Tax=Christiangramia echinicola TaxID=279359 RepID=A0A1H1NR28_9FLAO|nr:hypothetical protein [Christiangramia echinicola]SDS01373.1 hypothetical protein SAMN04488552_1824 [Christiangramia echinicola]